jgi:hypothetical protein
MLTLMVYDQDDSIAGHLVFTVYSQEVSMCNYMKTFVCIQCNVSSKIGQIRASMHQQSLFELFPSDALPSLMPHRGTTLCMVGICRV